MTSVRGLPRSQVVSDPNAGRLQSPSSRGRIGVPGIRTGRPVSVEGLAAATEISPLQQTLGEISRVLGGEAQNQYVQGQQAQFVKGQMLQAAGVSQEEAEIEGGTAATQRGYKTMELATSAQRWYDQTLQNVLDSDREMAPDEFAERQGEAFRELMTGDPAADNFLNAIGADLLPKVASIQAKAHADFNKQRTVEAYQDALMAVGTGKADMGLHVADLMDDANPLVSGLSEAEVSSARFEAARASLNQDRDDLYAVLQQQEFKGLTPGQQDTLYKAHQAMISRRSNEFNAELTLSLDALITDAQTGHISPQQGLERLVTLQERFERDDRWMQAQANQITGSIRAFRSSERVRANALEDAREVKRIADEGRPDADAFFAVQDVLFAQAQGNLTREEALEKVQEVVTSNGITDKSFLNRSMTQILSVNKQKFAETQRALVQEAEQAEQEASRNAALQAMAHNPTVFAQASAGDQKAAFTQIREQTAVEAQRLLDERQVDQVGATDWAAQKLVKEMARLSYVDPEAARATSTIIGRGVLDADGKVTAEAVQALEMVRQLQQEYGRADLAGKMLTTSEAKNVAYGAIENLSAYADPSEALRVSFQTNVSAQGSMQERAQSIRNHLGSPSGQQELRTATEAAVEDLQMSPSVLSGVGAAISTGLDATFGTGANNDLSRWMRSDRESFEHAVKHSDKFKEIVRADATRRMMQSPAIEMTTAVREAAVDVQSRSAVIAGQVITAPAGMSIKRQMGLEQFPGQGVEQFAMHQYLQEFGADLWGAQFGTFKTRVPTDIATSEDLLSTSATMHVQLVDDGRATAIAVTPLVPAPSLATQPAEVVASKISAALASLSGTGDLFVDPSIVHMPTKVIPLAEIGGLHRAERKQQLEQQ